MVPCRICPGRDFAVATLTIALASLLHVFNVDPPVDGEGNPISVERGMTDGVLSYVLSTRPSIDLHMLTQWVEGTQWTVVIQLLRAPRRQKL